MYLHLGQNTVVSDKEIIGIFDLDSTTVSKITRDFLNISEKEKRVINVGEPYELPKSFIISGKRENSRGYISQLAGATLQKRAKTAAGSRRRIENRY